MSEPVALKGLRTVNRGTQIAVCTIVLFGALVIREVRIHRRDGQCWVELPHSLMRKNQHIVDRFNRCLLSLIGFHHPEFFEHGRAVTPLLDTPQLRLSQPPDGR